MILVPHLDKNHGHSIVLDMRSTCWVGDGHPFGGVCRISTTSLTLPPRTFDRECDLPPPVSQPLPKLPDVLGVDNILGLLIGSV